MVIRDTIVFEYLNSQYTGKIIDWVVKSDNNITHYFFHDSEKLFELNRDISNEISYLTWACSIMVFMKLTELFNLDVSDCNDYVYRWIRTKFPNCDKF